MSLLNNLNVLQKSKCLSDPPMSPAWSSVSAGSVMKKLHKEIARYKNNLSENEHADYKVKSNAWRSRASSVPSHSSRIIAGTSRSQQQKRLVEPNMRQRRKRRFLRYVNGDRTSYKDRNRCQKKVLKKEKWRSDSEVGKKHNVKDFWKKSSSLHNGMHFQGRRMSHVAPDICLERGIGSGHIGVKANVHHSKSNAQLNVERELNFKLKRGLQEDGNNLEGILSCSNSSLSLDGKDGSISLPLHHQADRFLKRPITMGHSHKKGNQSPGSQPNEEESFEPSPGSAILKTDYVVTGSKRGLHKEFHRESKERPLVSDVSKQGCGIPWKWSKFHDKGRNILDVAGRSLSCGLSDSAIQKIDGFSSCSSSLKDFSAATETSEDSDSFLNSGSESVPLLSEYEISQESLDIDARTGKLSGELDLYAENVTKKTNNNMSFDSRARKNTQQRENFDSYHNHSRVVHGNQSLSQKYIPKTFDEVLGQNLVTQSLMNALLRGKIAPFYLFYGPHGTGKTSCARIFASALNCASMNACQPCGLCKYCQNLNLCQNSDVKLIASFNSSNFQNFYSALKHTITYIPSHRYGVLIIDDCDIMSSHDWKTFSKLLDNLPWNIVFIFITLNIDSIPHSIMSRCQKFLFSKLKEIDIKNKLQAIVIQECLEMDSDALELIAAKSNGSMRDAEMAVEQLSLLGQRVTLSLVQQLVGLIPDEKLVDLLDLALSADTVNTVKCLRDLMDSGAEPLALMSQLATLIADILTGSSKIQKDKSNKQYLRKETLSREEMNRLRKALKILSDAKKQILISSDRSTCLTAAVLQLAPDVSCVIMGSSTPSSTIQSPIQQVGIKENVNVGSSISSDCDEDVPPTVTRYLKVHSPNQVFTHKKELFDAVAAFESNSGDCVFRVYGKETFTVDGSQSDGQKIKDIKAAVFEGDDLPVYPSTSCNVSNLCSGLKTSPQSLSKSTLLQPPAALTISNLADHAISGEKVPNEFENDHSRMEKYCLADTNEHVDTGNKVAIRSSRKSREKTGQTQTSSPQISVSACSLSTSNKKSSDQALCFQQSRKSPLILSAQLAADTENLQNSSTQGMCTESQILCFQQSRKPSSLLSSQTAVNPETVPTECKSEQIFQEGNNGKVEGETLASVTIKVDSAVAEIEEQNMQLEPKTGGILCWKGSRTRAEKPRTIRNQARKRRLLCSLVPCGMY